MRIFDDFFLIISFICFIFIYYKYKSFNVDEENKNFKNSCKTVYKLIDDKNSSDSQNILINNIMDSTNPGLFEKSAPDNWCNEECKKMLDRLNINRYDKN